jgi:hypothetical protein
MLWIIVSAGGFFTISIRTLTKIFMTPIEWIINEDARYPFNRNTTFWDMPIMRPNAKNEMIATIR